MILGGLLKLQVGCKGQLDMSVCDYRQTRGDWESGREYNNSMLPLHVAYDRKARLIVYLYLHFCFVELISIMYSLSRSPSVCTL
jgi:hypothetical protein